MHGNEGNGEVTARHDTTPAPSTPKLVKQPHRGAILRCGVKGNKGGTGRPSNYSKYLSTVGFERGVERILERLEARDLADKDLARFVDLCGKYGPGAKVDVSKEVLEAVVAALITRCGQPIDRALALEIGNEIGRVLNALETGVSRGGEGCK